MIRNYRSAARPRAFSGNSMATVKEEEKEPTSSNPSTIRVKIWLSGANRQHGVEGRLLRFSPDQCYDLETLKERMAVKLGLTHSDAVDVSEYDVCLGRQGTAQVQHVNEIDYGDELLLIKKKAGAANVKAEKQRDKNSGKNEVDRAFSSRVKLEDIRNETADCKEEEESDNSVEDVTDQMHQQQASSIPFVEIIDIMDSDKEDKDSSSDDDESSYDEEDEEDDDVQSSEDDSDSSGEDYCEDKKPAAKNVPKKRKAASTSDSRLQVLIDEKDVPTAPGKHNLPSNEATLQESSILAGSGDQAVKDRIIKLLNTGFHDRSNENEAQNAMKLAQRLMRKHNLSQALLLQERDAKQSQGDHDDQLLKGGLVEVHIVNRKTRVPAKLERWISNLMNPVSKNFAVDSYYISCKYRCSVTFYGIYTNAQLAAYAFKIATERIAQMMADFMPIKRPYGRTVSTKSARLSYALGIVEGISEAVDADMKREEEQRRMKLRKAQLAASTGKVYEESGDEDDKEGSGFSFTADSTDDTSPSDSVGKRHVSSSLEPPLNKHSALSGSDDTEDTAGLAAKPDTNNTDCCGPRKKTLEGENLDMRVREMEREEQAALVLVDRREKIAEEVLKKNDIKLGKAAKRKPIQFDGASYRQGVEDSKEIDINQRAIRAEVKVKREKR